MGLLLVILYGFPAITLLLLVAAFNLELDTILYRMGLLQTHLEFLHLLGALQSLLPQMQVISQCIELRARWELCLTALTQTITLSKEKHEKSYASK